MPAKPTACRPPELRLDGCLAGLPRGLRAGLDAECQRTGNEEWPTCRFALLTFSNTIVGQRVRRFEAAAKAHAQPDWHHRPWHWYESNSRPDYGLSTDWRNAEKDAKHWISLGCDGPDGHSFSFGASLYPPECRWDLRVSYSENWHGDRQVQEHFMVTIFDRQKYPTASQPLIMIPCDSFGFSETFGPYEYAVGVNLNGNNLPLGTASLDLSSAQGLQAALGRLRPA